MLKKFTLTLLDLYQEYIRKALPCTCRFAPTCSEYARQAVIRFGLRRGAYKALRRIASCHPFSGKSGYHPLA